MGEIKLSTAAVVILKKLQAAVVEAPFPGIASTK
jgi:hypothetical protein